MTVAVGTSTVCIDALLYVTKCNVTGMHDAKLQVYGRTFSITTVVPVLKLEEFWIARLKVLFAFKYAKMT
jgi:hypothetical protein